MNSLIEILSRVVSNETQGSNNLRFGTVNKVDTEKQRMRLRLGGTDSEPFLSPWIPYGQTAGKMKFHNPPSEGQQFAVMSNGGDLRQSVAIPFTWSDQNQSPSKKGDEHVMTFGSAIVTVKEKQVMIQVGGAKVDITDQGITLEIGGTKFQWTGSGLKAAAPDYDWE